MKKRPSLILREPVKLYETKEKSQSEKEIVEKTSTDNQKIFPEQEETKLTKSLATILSEENYTLKRDFLEPVREKMSPRVQQIWDYLCRKAVESGEVQTSFGLTRSEVMKEAGIGSTNTYRDALKKFKELGLLEIELRPGVNSGSLFIFTEKGREYLK